MGSVFSAREMDHAIDAGESGAPAAVSMRVELLLGENVTAGLASPADDGLDGSRAQQAIEEAVTTGWVGSKETKWICGVCGWTESVGVWMKSRSDGKVKSVGRISFDHMGGGCLG